MFKNMRRDEGFTLVELMVVVLIIGILVAIAIPIFNNASNNAKVKTCAANIRTMRGAIEQYVALDPANAYADIDSADNLVTEGVLKAAPTCPFGTAYVIADGVVTDHTH